MEKYWKEEQESAVVRFVTTTDLNEKQTIFYSDLEKGFSKMIENIYHTYNFHIYLPEYDNEKHELLLFIFEKLDNFDPSYGKKAFSYFGRVIKNWFIQRSNKSKKRIHFTKENNEVLTSNMSISNFSTDEHNLELVNFIFFLSEKIKNSCNYKDMLDNDDVEIINILSYILTNYGNFDIYNKKQLYVYLKEATQLPARKITKTLKKVKEVYVELKKSEY